MEDNNIRNNNIFNKSQKNFKTNYTNQRQYSDEYLESFYENLKWK